MQTQGAMQISKITAVAVLGADYLKNWKDSSEEGKRVEVIRITGHVEKIKTGPSSLNPENMDTKMSGEFMATNMVTGEIFTAPVLYPMGAAMNELMSKAEPGSMFALRVFMQHSNKSPTKYGFDFQSAIEIKPSEAILKLQDAFAGLPPAARLAAPKNEAESDEKKGGKKSGK